MIHVCACFCPSVHSWSVHTKASSEVMKIIKLTISIDTEVLSEIKKKSANSSIVNSSPEIWIKIIYYKFVEKLWYLIQIKQISLASSMFVKLLINHIIALIFPK